MPLIYGPGPGDETALQSASDLQGLPVDDVDGRPAAEVFGVLAEADNGLIRYVDVAAAAKHVLVPIGHTRFEDHADGMRVRLRAATREDLAKIPAFDPEATEIDSAYQSELLMHFGRLFYGERYYAHPAYDHSHVFAGEHPVDSDAEAAGEARSLELLSRLRRWRVVRGESDVRGWAVTDTDRASVGRISDLVIEPQARTVRYLVVALDADRSVLLPIGYASIDRQSKSVRAGPFRRSELASLPPFSGTDALTREAEAALRERLDALLTGERRYERPDFALPPTSAARSGRTI